MKEKFINYIKSIRLTTNLDDWLNKDDWKIVWDWVIKISIITLVIFLINEKYIEKNIILVKYKDDYVQSLNEILINIIVSIFTIVIPLLMIPIEGLSKKYSFIKESFIRKSKLFPIILFSVYILIFIIIISLGNNFSILGYLIGLFLFSFLIFEKNKKKIILIISLIFLLYISNTLNLFVENNGFLFNEMNYLINYFSIMVSSKIYVTFYLSMSVFILLTHMFPILKLLIELNKDETQIKLLKEYFNNNSESINTKIIYQYCNDILNLLDSNILEISAKEKRNEIKQFFEKSKENPNYFQNNIEKIQKDLLWEIIGVVDDIRKYSMYEIIDKKIRFIRNSSYFYKYEIIEKIFDCMNESNEYNIDLWMDFLFNELFELNIGKRLFFSDFIDQIFVVHDLSQKQMLNLSYLLQNLFKYIDVHFSENEDDTKIFLLLKIYRKIILLDNNKIKDIWLDNLSYNEHHKIKDSKKIDIYLELIKISFENNDYKILDKIFKEVIHINSNIFYQDYSLLTHFIFYFFENNYSEESMNVIINYIKNLDNQKYLDNLFYYIELNVSYDDEIITFSDIDDYDNIPRYIFSIIFLLLVNESYKNNILTILEDMKYENKPIINKIINYNNQIIYYLNKYRNKIIVLDKEYNLVRMAKKIDKVIIDFTNYEKL